MCVISCAARVLFRVRWYVLHAMRPNATLRAGFALLFALLLPLQGYAALPACPRHERTAATATAPLHCADGASAVHRHGRATFGCGNCCGAAIALTPVDFVAPLLTAPEISVAAPGFPPKGLLDRLDRPPRHIPA
jgi:hypothetical protein